MIKSEQFRYYILLVVAISVMSLALSIVGLRQKVGRYQFLEAGAHIHVLDTKTGRIFSRGLIDFIRPGKGKNIWLDLGTINEPLQIESKPTSGYEAWKAENERMKFADDSSNGHSAKQSSWEEAAKSLKEKKLIK